MTLPARISSRESRLSDCGLFIACVGLVLLAWCAAGLFFVGGAIRDMTEDLRDVQVSLTEIRRDVGELREDIGTMREDVASLRQDVSRFRAEVSRRFDVIEPQ